MTLRAAEQDEGGREGDTVVLGFDSGDDLGEERATGESGHSERRPGQCRTSKAEGEILKTGEGYLRLILGHGVTLKRHLCQLGCKNRARQQSPGRRELVEGEEELSLKGKCGSRRR